MHPKANAIARRARRNLLACTVGVLITATPCAVLAAPVKLDTPAKQFSYAIGLQIGARLKTQEFTDLDPAAIAEAMQDVFAGRKPRLSREQMRAAAQAYEKIAQARQTRIAEANAKAEKVFLAKYGKRPGVIVLPSGIEYRVLKAGTGKKPGADSSVTVDYRGRLMNGTEFDSSYKRGKPTTFQISKVIKGWQEVLPLMKVGAEWEVVIPSKLAYGEHGAGGVIGPNQPLIFDIHLLKINS